MLGAGDARNSRNWLFNVPHRDGGCNRKAPVSFSSLKRPPSDCLLVSMKRQAVMSESGIFRFTLRSPGKRPPSQAQWLVEKPRTELGGLTMPFSPDGAPGGSERRRSARGAHSVPVQWCPVSAGRTHFSPGVLRNLSAEGFCLVVDAENQAGGVLTIGLAGHVESW